jgi:hypothetical protein
LQQPVVDRRIVCSGQRTTQSEELFNGDASTVDSCQFDVAGPKRFGLFSQNGPKDEVCWIRYDNFSIIGC